MRPISFMLPGVALGAIIYAGQALAQPSATRVVEVSTPSPSIQDIVVTARRTSERLQDVPVAVTAVTTQAISDLSMRDVLEIQKIAPGLNVASQGSSGRAKFAIRGQTEADSRLNTDGSVGIYIDSVNIPRSYGIRSAFVDIAQVEVLKGPQGTLYGKNTTGGALNITTQKPTFDLGGYVDLLVGNYDNRQVLGVLNVPIVDDKLAVRAVLQRIDRDGYGRDAAGHPVNDDNVTSGRLHVLVQPSERVKILLSGDFVHQRNNAINSLPSADNMLAVGNGATRALGQIAYELGLNPNSASDRLIAYAAFKREHDRYASGELFYDSLGSDKAPDNVDVRGGSATIDAELGSGIDFKSITSYRWLKENRLTVSPYSFRVLTAPSSSEARNFSQELQLSSINGRGLDWQAGLFYSREKGNEFQATNVNPNVNLAGISGVADGDITNRSKAAYLQATYNFSSRFRFTGGLRYTEDFRGIEYHNRIDPSFANVPLPVGTSGRCALLIPALGGPTFPNCSYDKNVDFNAVTYLASIDYRPSDDLMIYASHSKGYRSGGLTSQSPAAPLTSLAAQEAAFSPYKPEIVYNYEVGVKSEWFDRKLRLNASAYYQNYKDVQQQIRDVVNGVIVSLIRNAAKAKIYGGEVELTASPTRNFQLNAGASYVHARYDEFLAVDAAGNQLDFTGRPFPVPEWQFNVGANYTVPLEDGSLRANINYAWMDDQVFRPDAALVDSVTQKAYGLLDARLAWQIDSAKLEIAVFGKNLTNKRYAIAATNLESIGFNNLFPGNPRTYGIQLRKSF